MSTKPDDTRGDHGTSDKSGKGHSSGSERSGTLHGNRMEGIGEATAGLRDELHHVGEVARDVAYEQMENLKARGVERAHQLEDRIVDEPLKAVAIAVAVGFFLGLMWKRR